LADGDLAVEGLPGDNLALFGGSLDADDFGGGDLARRGFTKIGTSATRFWRARRETFAAGFLRDRERAMKPRTHRASVE
jgi:hypothetical protein